MAARPTWDNVNLHLSILPPPRYPDDTPLTPTAGAHNGPPVHPSARTKKHQLVRLIRHIERPFAYLILYALVSAVVFIQFSWGVVLGDVSDELNDQRLVGWLNTGFLGGFACLVGLVGKTTIVVSPSYIFYGSSVLMFAAMFITGLNRGPVVLVTARILSGTAAPGMLIGAFFLASSLLTNLSPTPQFILTLFFTTSLFAGTIAGPTIGALIAKAYGWRMMYQMIAVEIAGMLALVLVSMRYTVASETKGLPIWRRMKKLKIAELVAIPLILVPAVVLNGVAGKPGMGDFYVLMLLVATGCLIALSIYLHFQFGHIFNIPRHFVAKPAIWAIAGVSWFMGAALVIMNTYLPLYYMVVRHVPQQVIPKYVVFYSVAVFIGAVLGTPSFFTHHTLLPTILGCLLTALGSLTLAYQTPSPPIAPFSPLPVLTGLGIGLSLTQPFIQAYDLPDEDRNPAFLLIALFFSLGSATHLAASNVFYMQRVLNIMGRYLDSNSVLSTGFTVYEYRFPAEWSRLWQSAHAVGTKFVMVQVFVLSLVAALVAVGAGLKGIRKWIVRGRGGHHVPGENCGQRQRGEIGRAL